jgi:hypothetical protein
LLLNSSRVFTALLQKSLKPDSKSEASLWLIQGAQTINVIVVSTLRTHSWRLSKESWKCQGCIAFAQTLIYIHSLYWVYIVLYRDS